MNFRDAFWDMVDGLWECWVLTVLSLLGWSIGILEIVIDRKFWDWFKGKK